MGKLYFKAGKCQFPGVQIIGGWLYCVKFGQKGFNHASFLCARNPNLCTIERFHCIFKDKFTSRLAVRPHVLEPLLKEHCDFLLKNSPPNPSNVKVSYIFDQSRVCLNPFLTNKLDGISMRLSSRAFQSSLDFMVLTNSGTFLFINL